MRAVFDVGANDGSFGIMIAQLNPDVMVFGFEPTPQLASVIREKSKDLKNYELIPVAVSDRPGQVKFNVAGLQGYGVSSMLEFADGLDQTWPGRTDFEFTETIEVEALRLDKFVESRGIKQIAFLHVDTQGTDLDVLRSLGNYLGIVERGQIETSACKRVSLYKGQHTMEDVVLFFLQHGLEIDSIVPDNPNNNEFNVQFVQRRQPGHP
jgi:FkbM family methyltransferase